MDYLQQVRRGIDYVEEHLDQDIALVDVSRAAGVSHWHFLRMFKALTDETLKAYIRSRRLAQARLELLLTDATVLEIALRAGFESQASFARAFRKAFDVPPARYRDLGGDAVHLHKVRIDEDYLRHLHDGLSREPALETFGPRRMVGLSTTFFSVDSERNNIAAKLPSLWDTFVPKIDTIGGALSGTGYGIIQPSPDTERLSYVAAIEVAPDAPLPEGMVAVDLPEAQYAVFTHCGRPEQLDHTVNFVYSSWLLRSGFRHTGCADVEIYDERWKPGSDASVMEYAIPVQPG